MYRFLTFSRLRALLPVTSGTTVVGIYSTTLRKEMTSPEMLYILASDKTGQHQPQSSSDDGESPAAEVRVTLGSSIPSHSSSKFRAPLNRVDSMGSDTFELVRDILTPNSEQDSCYVDNLIIPARPNRRGSNCRGGNGSICSTPGGSSPRSMSRNSSIANSPRHVESLHLPSDLPKLEISPSMSNVKPEQH